jgi:hypothetical protein
MKLLLFLLVFYKNQSTEHNSQNKMILGKIRVLKIVHLNSGGSYPAGSHDLEIKTRRPGNDDKYACVFAHGVSLVILSVPQLIVAMQQKITY